MEFFVKVKVLTKANQEEVIQKTPDEFVVKVKEKPVRNLANKSVIRLLAEFLKISPQQIQIIKGFHRSRKIFKIVYN